MGRYEVKMRVAILIGLFIATNAFSAGVPTAHKITPNNAASLNFHLSTEFSGEPYLKIGTLKYPKSIDGYFVARVQTQITDFSDRHVAFSSVDALISDNSSSLLFAFNSELYDMSICVQYGKARKGGMYYDRSYCIDSVSNHLITSTSNGTKTVG
jgi:hypothetical protein